MNKTKTQIREIKTKLKSLHKKKVFISVIVGLNLVLVFALFLNVFLSLVELSGFSGMEERAILYFSGLTTIGTLVLCLIVFALIKTLKIISKEKYKVLAENVGNYYPEIGDKLVNALDLGEKKESRYSESLISAAIESVYKKSKNIDFKKAAFFSKTKPYFLTSFTTIIVTVLLFSLSPGLRTASYRILNYSQKFIRPPSFVFYISPGNIEIEKNLSLVIKIEIIGEKPKTINFLTKANDEPVFIKQTIFPDTNGVFHYHATSIKNSFLYYAESAEIKSETFSVEVTEKPIISDLELVITPPKYSMEKDYVQKDNGNIISLIGSKVEFKIRSNKPLTNGHILFSDSTKHELSINQQQANGSFSVTNSKEYSIIIYDEANSKNKNPITYSIVAKKDEHPALTIIKPHTKIKLTKLEQVFAELKISDDYGFKKLLLHHKLSESNFEKPSDNYSTINIDFDKTQREQKVFYVWDVSALILAAGDVVSFYFEVFDNDNISGSKSTKSKMLTLYVPTLEELYEEAEVAQEETTLELEEVLLEAEKLSQEMEKLSNELKVDKKEIDWEEQKKLEETAQKFEELKSKIEKAQNKIEKSQNELQQNDLLSQETLEKYMELQKLMDEMNSDEMNLAMKKIQEQLATMNRDKAQNSLEEMKFDEESFKKSLERTLSLLKRIQIEQKMDEVVNRAEEIKAQLESLEQETKDSDLSENGKSKELSKKQDDISKKLENLKEEMDKLQEKMSDLSDMPNEEMSELQNKMESQKNEELSKEAKKQLSNHMKKEAMEQMQMLSKNMQSTSEQMKNMQQQMQMQNQLQTMYDMMKAVNNLVELSKLQESLKENTENSNSSQLLKTAPEQEEIMAGLEKTISQMQQLSQKTFAITPEMGKALGQAQAEMMTSMNAMQNQNSSMAALSQSGAMKHLNEAATMMKGKMDQMMNGGQGGGMMSMMQQMQQLSQQQMNLNKLTKQLNKGSMSQQQQQELQRLSKEQEMIRKSLEELNRENQERGQSKKLTSNLENVLNEMEEVIKKMRTEKINDDLIQSQEKILSKLLDAQRSINQRDFEERRESNEGTMYSRTSPEDLKINEEQKDRLREELMKAIREGYSNDYEEIIRKYYEALDGEENKLPISN